MTDNKVNQIDITIYTIVYNGYGVYLDKWLKGALTQDFKAKVIVVLGENHKTPPEVVKMAIDSGVKVIYENNNSVMGSLYNVALNNADSEWVLRVDADDVPLPNAITEVAKKQDYDLVSLRYILNKTDGVRIKRRSAMIDINDILNWGKEPLPGYIANRRKYNGKILYYEDTEIPNYPYLFLMASLGFKSTRSDAECIDCFRRVGSHGDTALKTNKHKEYKRIINGKAMDIYNSIKNKTKRLISK